MQLKHEVGAGYHVTVPDSVPITPLGSVRKPTAEEKITYWFPSGIEATKYINQLRENGIKDYDFIGPTLENVFLALAEEVKENHLDTEPATFDTQTNPKVADGAPHSDHSSEVDKGLQMSKGQGTSMPKQTWILIQKRFTILRRNYLPYICALLLPVITAGLVTLFLQGFEAIGCDPGEQASDPTVFSLDNVDVTPLIPIGPSGLVDIELIARRSGLNTSAFHIVNTIDEFNAYIAQNFHNVTPGGFFLPPDDNQPPLMSYVGNGGVIGGVITLSSLDNILTGVPISTQYQQFAVPFAPSTGDTLQLILYFGLAMSVYPAFFALYPTVERLRKVRALHYSNGIRAAPLWVAYLFFDFCFVLLISAIVTGIFAGVSSYNCVYRV